MSGVQNKLASMGRFLLTLLQYAVETPPSFPVSKQSVINNRYNSIPSQPEDEEDKKVALLADQEIPMNTPRPYPSSHNASKSSDSRKK